MNWGNSWKFALVLSVLVHIFIVSLFLMVPASVWLVEGRGGQEKKAGESSNVVKRLVIRKQAEKKADEVREGEREEKKQQPDFVKTSAHQPKDDRPKESPHVGSRSTKAEGGAKAPDDMREMPAQDGEKPKDGEIVLFDQNRQDGSLDHDDDGAANVSRPVVKRVVKNDPRPVLRDPAMAEANRTGEDTDDDASPAPESRDGVLTNGAEAGAVTPEWVSQSISKPNPQSVSQPASQPVSPDQAERNESVKPDRVRDSSEESPPRDEAGEEGAEGRDEGEKEAAHEMNRNDHGKPESPAQHENEADAVSQPGKNLMENERVKSLPPVADSGKKAGMTRPLLAPAGSGGGSRLPPPLTRKNKRPVYDPVFSETAQPGFRTQERRTRTSGRFSFGRNPSLDVAATPMGRYQEIVYRAIAMVWYDQCDRNRDLIVTGTLRIRILLNPKGDVVSMKLLSRSGASVAQNSFTFVAIKAAPIPPMPPEVRKELIGDRMELFFDFNF